MKNDLVFLYWRVKHAIFYLKSTLCNKFCKIKITALKSFSIEFYIIDPVYYSQIKSNQG